MQQQGPWQRVQVLWVYCFTALVSWLVQCLLWLVTSRHVVLASYDTTEQQATRLLCGSRRHHMDLTFTSMHVRAEARSS